MKPANMTIGEALGVTPRQLTDEDRVLLDRDGFLLVPQPETVERLSEAAKVVLDVG